ncbi:MAG: hypothetical protein AB1690_05465 [Candidatus Zixiibacteriota bacterium]|jgi:hypothetical protein
MKSQLSLFFFALITISAIFPAGCTLANRNRVRIKTAEQTAPKEKLRGDAYLLDVKINREGKKSSFRLDLYQSEETLAWFARGYLGKGVMKGVLTNDSLIVYFPTEEEFYSGKLNALAKKSCLGNAELESVLGQLFRILPPEISSLSDNFYLTILKEDDKQRRYILNYKDCGGGIRLDYEKHDLRFLISNIQYIGEEETFGFEAKVRDFRLDTDLPADKFEIAIPSTATRLNP